MILFAPIILCVIALFLAGWLFGPFLFVQLFLRKRLLAWILPFALGLFLLLLGLFLLFLARGSSDLAHTSPKEIAWIRDVAGNCITPVPFLWFIAGAIFCYFVYYKRHFNQFIHELPSSIEMPVPTDGQGK